MERTHKGKVRDTYDLGDGRLLIVSTDRLSAFDVVLPTGIARKGEVLNRLSGFWFGKTRRLFPNHFLRIAWGVPEDNLPFQLHPDLAGRSVLVFKAQRLDVECVVRGYLSGSAWVDYQNTGKIFSIPVPAGMRESEKLPVTLFTPTTKAQVGHDLPMAIEEVAEQIGEKNTLSVMNASVLLYEFAAEYALSRGVIIADSKFEFGIVDGEPIVIDEMLTPDSSRFWPAGSYEPGRGQFAFDKQYVRDWLTKFGWNREPPAPSLPEDVAQQTSERYLDAYRILTGEELDL